MSSLHIAYFQNPDDALNTVVLNSRIKLTYKSNNILKLWGHPLQEQDTAFCVFE